MTSDGVRFDDIEGCWGRVEEALFLIAIGMRSSPAPLRLAAKMTADCPRLGRCLAALVSLKRGVLGKEENNMKE